MADRGYFKELILRKSIDALGIAANASCGLVHAGILVACDSVGFLDGFAGPGNSARSLDRSLWFGFAMSLGFVAVAAFWIISMMGSDWNGPGNRDLAARAALEQVLVESTRPGKILRELARRYMLLGLAAVLLSTTLIFALSVAAHHDLLGLKKDPTKDLFYLYSAVAVGANTLSAAAMNHFLRRWVDHDRVNERF